MRVLIAPDKFAGTLTAPQAAEAIAHGWRGQAPDDELDLAPMSDGGPGFVDVLHAALGGELLATAVPGPFEGDFVPATILKVADVAYIESAQACGIELTGTDRPEEATSYGVGVLLGWAADLGVRRIVVGLGGSGTTDGGAGLLAALGTRSDAELDEGPRGLGSVGEVDLTPARELLSGIELVIASDVDNPLTGMFGAAKTFGPQKGLAADRIAVVDAALERFAQVADRRTALKPGAGAAGGLGYALLLLGGERVPGISLVAEAVDLPGRAQRADLVITGEGAFDFSSRSGKVPYGVAEIANEALRPCVAIAGQVLVGSREMRALGMDSAYGLVDVVGEQRAFADPAGALGEVAARVARTWSR